MGLGTITLLRKIQTIRCSQVPPLVVQVPLGALEEGMVVVLRAVEVMEEHQGAVVVKEEVQMVVVAMVHLEVKVAVMEVIHHPVIRTLVRTTVNSTVAVMAGPDNTEVVEDTAPQDLAKETRDIITVVVVDMEVQLAVLVKAPVEMELVVTEARLLVLVKVQEVEMVVAMEVMVAMVEDTPTLGIRILLEP